MINSIKNIVTIEMFSVMTKGVIINRSIMNILNKGLKGILFNV
jgi:hypothetical protein